MTPQEKAKELVNQFSKYAHWDDGSSNNDFNSINSAIIAVETIRSEYSGYRVKHYLTLEHALELRKYWDEVLDCLNAL